MTLKTVCFFFTFFLLTYKCYTQAPDIEWQNTIGGNGSDELFDLQQTPDKGFIVGSSSSSGMFGDKTESSFGVYDYWILKLDSIGNIEWQNTIGGDDYDHFRALDFCSDGGYIIGGYSNSSASVDKTENAYAGSYDYWIVKLDSTGNIEWEKTVGGDAADYLADIIQCPDGSYLAGGTSYSGISGDKTESAMGEADYWVVKLDTAGTILWENTIGGDMGDILTNINPIHTTSKLLGGGSNSGISGDKTEESIEGAFGVNTLDYWIVQIMGIDSIAWQNTIGGNSADNFGSSNKTFDGGLVIGGNSPSGISGDKTESPIGGGDFWVLKIDSLGEIEWQNTIGSTIDESFTTIFQTFDGNYLLCGYTDAGISGDKTEVNYGGEDWWILRLDTLGNIVWQNSIGGNGSDILTKVIQTLDGGYLLGGYSSSNTSIDKTEDSYAGFDIWIVKLYPDVFCTPVTYYADADADGFGNITFSILTCDTTTAYVLDNTDCNDLNAAINPVAFEICNTVDDNCNGVTDDGIPYYNFYADIDGDGFGNMTTDTNTCLSIIAGYVADSTDCNDLNNKIHEETIYYADSDGDLYGDSLNFVFACSAIPPKGFVSNILDCDDANPFINPVSNEIENGIDDNCNDTIDEGYTVVEDLHYSDFSVYPNPNTGSFIISFSEHIIKDITIEVYNSIGEKIYSERHKNITTFEMKLNNSYSGVANIVIKTDDFTLNKSIHVMK